METESISQLILAKAQQFGPKLALCLHGSESGESLTYRQLDRESGRLAAEFMDLGLQPNDRVVILCESRPRWGIAFFATVRAGGVVVPVDIRMPANELLQVLNEAAPGIVVVSRAQEAAIAPFLQLRGSAVTAMSIEPASCRRPFPSIDVLHQTNIHPCVARNDSDAAVITFTSGTTGSAKGVVTTFGNLLHQIRSFRSVMKNDSHCSAVSILPLSHLFELTAGFLGLLYGGGQICYVNTLMPDDIIAAMQEQEITCMATVPLFLKLLANGIRKEVAKLPPLRRRLFMLAQRVSPLLPRKIRRRVFSKIHQRFGGKLEYFVSGGAPLDECTMRFFDSIGLPVYQGYGLAEASPVITTNGPLANRPGSVGKALPGVELRIDQNNGGEVLTRGPHIMRGYFGDLALTQKIVDRDGWLHTGDIGYIDDDGFLFVSGRQKNIIVLGSGKKVQPEEIEDVLFEHPYIQEGCIIGTIARNGLLAGSEEVCAIAVASEVAIRECTSSSADLLNELRSVIQQRAEQLAPCKRPTRIVLRTEPLPRTSSRKVRRHSLREWLAQEVMSS